MLIEAGLNPKSIEDILYVRFIDNGVDCKYVGGIKGDAAWFAVFDKNGEEIESYIFPNTGSPDYCSYPHSYKMHENSIMLTVTEGNETSTFNQNIVSFASEYSKNPTLYTLDRNTQKIKAKIAGMETEDGRFWSDFNDFGCLIYAFNPERYRMYFINQEGVIKWERAFKEEENNPETAIRGGMTFISEEEVIFSNGYEYRVINLKTYTLKFIIEKDSLPMTGELFGRQDVYCENEEWVWKSNKLLFVFSEYENKKIIDDPVSGNHHYQYVLMNKYAYEINPENGEIIGFGKYN